MDSQAPAFAFSFRANTFQLTDCHKNLFYVSVAVV